MGEVEGVDTVGRVVLIRDTDQVPYDYLVLATGSVYSWFGHDAWRARSTALKTLDDAEAIRLRVLGAFERAESRNHPDEIRTLLTFVIVGGGPTGVEMAGAIAELADYARPRLPPHRPDGGPSGDLRGRPLCCRPFRRNCPIMPGGS